ncbi:kinase-like protein [Auriscalpium vulgare]|uniref:Kinase-like protein n=1 Tax=Auriscalpium vulgare TaxID=40419 RepID=A0ACB8S960_9AGAM|nr:kinase-like protein [Auriscalpium vulgare]
MSQVNQPSLQCTSSIALDPAYIGLPSMLACLFQAAPARARETDKRVLKFLGYLMHHPKLLDVWRGAHFVYQVDLRFHYIGRKAERDAEKARFSIETAPKSLNRLEIPDKHVEVVSPTSTASPTSVFASRNKSSVSSATSISVQSCVSEDLTEAPGAPGFPLGPVMCAVSVNDGHAHYTSEPFVFAPTPNNRPPCPRPLTVKDLKPIKVLGAGSFGTVYLAKDRRTGIDLAVKVMDEVLLEEHRVLRALETEKGFLQMRASWHDSANFFIATDYCKNGDLATELDRWGKMPELYVRFLAGELLVSLERLHSLGIVHRDIKPENVLFDDAGHLLVADFGLARMFGENQTTESPAYDVEENKCPRGSTKRACGSLDFMAPEVLQSQAYSYGVDYWSLGVLIYLLLTGRTPFAHGRLDQDLLVAAILGEDFSFEESDVSTAAKDFVRSLLHKDPAQRPTLSAMKAHPFFADVDWLAMAERTAKPPSVPVPHKIRSDGEGLVIPHGTPYYAGEDPLPEFTFTSPILYDPPQDPSFFPISNSTLQYSSLPATPRPEEVQATEIPAKPVKAPLLAEVGRFFRRHFGGEKPKPLDDPALGVITKTVTVTVVVESNANAKSANASSSGEPKDSKAPFIEMDPHRPGFPLLTIYNILEPEENRTPIPSLPSDVSFPLPTIRDSMLPRFSPLYYQVKAYDEEQEWLMAHPPKPKLSDKVQNWLQGHRGKGRHQKKCASH